MRTSPTLPTLPFYQILSPFRRHLDVLCNKASRLLRSATCGFLVMLWFNITQTHRHRHTHTHTHSETSRLSHSNKNIFTTPVMYSQQLSLLFLAAIFIINSLISKTYFPQCLFVSKIIHLYKSYICWLHAIRLGSSYETQVILTEMV